jgi:TsgA-like MFS transporter
MPDEKIPVGAQRLKLANLPATLLAVATYAIVAGVFTQGGAILPAAAGYFHASLPDAAAVISSTSVGNLAGVVASIFLLNVWPLSRTIVLSYIVVFLGIVGVALTHDLHVASLVMFPVGFGLGTGLSGGALIIARLYSDRARAFVFLCTDCAFSACGFALPALTSAAIAAHGQWWSGYALVAACAAIAAIAATRTSFPDTTATVIKHPKRTSAPNVAYATIGLYGVGLTLFITGQSSFTIWMPAVLQSRFADAAVNSGVIVSVFYGASGLGLLTAALLVRRISPRIMLVTAAVCGSVLTLALTNAGREDVAYLTTFLYGSSTACMFKLMISLGSEQLPSSSPSVVSILILCGGIGVALAPLVSAQIVRGFGLTANAWLTFGSYTCVLVVVIGALTLERWTHSPTSRT